MTSFTPKHSKFEATGKFLSTQTELRTSVPLVAKKLQKLLEEPFPPYASFTSATFVQDVPSSVKRMIKEEFGVAFSTRMEAYAVIIRDGIKVYSHSERGLVYGALALAAAAQEGFLHHGLLYESPAVELRGAKIYLPGRSGISFFKEFVDFLVEFRMNTLMIEIGGAMEYRRHPEINDAWVNYCKETREYSGKADVIQNWTYDWKKNSIHAENGEGGFLTQEEVRELVQYCRDSHVEIIPEVPSFSHSDYLLLAHPELREREGDPYPDTYCPSNEGSYSLLFDVLDEVIEVFDPKVINIGHDEAYTFGKCKQCAGKDPIRLFTEDILRIRKYLAERSIQIHIWGDKLLDARVDGKPCGGAHITKDYDDKETIEEIPPIYPAIEHIPKDVGIVHWYWGLDDTYDDVFHEHGLSVVYGNFTPLSLNHWRQRLDKGIRGAIISNWSSLCKDNLQRNGVYFDLAFANLLYWEDDYSESMANSFAKHAMEMLYAYNYHSVRHGIRILHNTDMSWSYKVFYDGFFILHEEYELGSYRITFADGRTLQIPIEYGKNISSADNEWSFVERKLPEVTLTTLPRRIHSAGQTVTAYEFIIETDGSPVTSVVYEPDSGKEAKVFLYQFEVF